MNNLQKEIKEWTDSTFGFNGVSSIIASLYHLSDEVEELRAAIVSGDITSISKEYADCFILLLHTALSSGLNFDDITRAIQLKMEINRSRTWGKSDARGVIKHIEE